MDKSINRRSSVISIHTLLNYLLLVALCLYSYFAWRNYVNWQAHIFTLVISTIIIQSIFNWKHLEIKSFSFWFVVLSYLFMFGRVFLYALDLSDKMFGRITYEGRFSAEDMYHASLFALCGIQAFVCGITNYKKTYLQHEDKWFDFVNDSQIRTAGIILLLLSLPLRLYTDLRFVIIAQSQSSYGSISGVSGYITTLAYLSIPALMMILISVKDNKTILNAVFVLSVGYNLVIMVLSGDRRYQMTAIIALILFYVTIRDAKIKLWKIILLGIGGIILLGILTTIRKIRYGNLTNLTGFMNSFLSSGLGLGDIVTEIMSEFGISFFSLAGAVQHVPDNVSYSYGLTFLYSIPSILPIGFLFSGLFKMASPARAINELTNLNVGSCLLTDMYANFGWISLVFLIIAGKVLGRVFLRKSSDYKMRTVFYYSLFFILINLVRASFMEVLRAAVWCYFIPYLILKLVSGRTRMQ